MLLGMQALLGSSEENGGVDCLDIIPGEVRYFGNPLNDSEGARLKVPHMGWNEVREVRPNAVARKFSEIFYRSKLDCISNSSPE